MCVSTTTFGPTVWAAPPIDFPQFRGADRRDMYFDEHNPFSPEKTMAQIRARMFFEQFEESLGFQKKGQSSLQTLLSRTLHIVPCISGLVGGTVVSLMTHHPLALLLGLSECSPSVFAQQKVGNEFQVNTYTINMQSDPSVVSLSNGNFVVIWKSDGQDGSSAGVYGQLFDDSAAMVGNEFLVNTFTPNAQSDPSVASFSNGNFIVVWNSNGQDGSRLEVYGQLFDDNANKMGNEFRVNTYTIDSQFIPSVASFSDDNFVVTWTSFEQDGSDYGVYGQLFDKSAAKLGNEFRVNTYTMYGQANPSVVSFPNDNFVVSWKSFRQDGDGAGIYGQLFNANAGKVGNEFQVNTYTINNQWSPSVASLSNGNFVVTWESIGQDDSSDGVYGQLFNANAAKLGNEFRVNTYTPDFQRHPSVTNCSNGNFVVTWESNGQDSSGYGIYGQLFDGNISKIGSEFQVNTYTNSGQGNPSVASFSNGNFVVTWQSSGQDGPHSGVYGQIFNDFPVSSTTSTTSTTKTSSTTSSVSSSTMSAIGRTRTSVNPSSSITVSSTTRPITTSNSRATLSATSDPSNRFSWIWFLLGGVGAVSCLGLTGYFIFRSRGRKKDGDVYAFALGKRKQTDDSTAETHYQRTPDFVTAVSDYQFTPDHVTVGRESDYQYTPDHVGPEAGRRSGRERDDSTGEGDYLCTPDFVTAV